METTEGLIPTSRARLLNVDNYTMTIFRTILGGLCTALGAIFVYGFSSGDVLDSRINIDTNVTTTTRVDVPVLPPQFPDSLSPETTVSTNKPPSTRQPHHSPQRSAPASTTTTAESSDASSNQPDSQTEPSSQAIKSPRPPQRTSVAPQTNSTTQLGQIEPSGNSQPIDDSPPSGTNNKTNTSAGTVGVERNNIPDQEKTSGSKTPVSNGSDDGTGAGNKSGMSQGSDAETGDSIGGPTIDITGTAVVFKTCAEAYEAGAAPITKDQPGYSLRLDRDMDGIACELNLDL